MEFLGAISSPLPTNDATPADAAPVSSQGNRQKMLDLIAASEGGEYDLIVGGKKRFSDFSKHPDVVGLTTKDGPSTAAGRYQITGTTYRDMAKQLGITDFSPASQDKIAIALLERRGALADVDRGDFDAAIAKLGDEWVSLPSSKNKNQPKRDQAFIDKQLGKSDTPATLSTGQSAPQAAQQEDAPQAFKVSMPYPELKEESELTQQRLDALMRRRKGAAPEGELSATLFGNLDAPKPVSKAVPEVAKTEAPDSPFWQRIGTDPVISLVKGTIAVPETVVGIADIFTGGHAGKFLEERLGFRPKEAKEILDTWLSDEQQAVNADVEKAEGFVDTLGTMASRPSSIVHTVLESAPNMAGGAVIGRGVVAGVNKLAPQVAAKMGKTLPVAAAAAGEGVVGAGSAAEQIRQQTGDGLLTGKQSAAAVGSGAGTAVLGFVGGKLAQKLGIADIDTVLTSGATQATAKGFTRRLIEGGISEGAFEEMPQSMQEQAWQNYALGKPIGKGVSKAGAVGLMAGAAQGGPTSALFNGDGTPAEAKPTKGASNPLFDKPAAAPAAAPEVDPVARLAELERKAKGTPDTKTVGEDGKEITIPGEQPQFLSDAEKAEYKALQSAVATPAAPTAAEVTSQEAAKAVKATAGQLSGMARKRALELMALDTRTPDQEAEYEFLGKNATNPDAIATAYGITKVDSLAAASGAVNKAKFTTPQNPENSQITGGMPNATAAPLNAAPNAAPTAENAAPNATANAAPQVWRRGLDAAPAPADDIFTQESAESNQLKSEPVAEFGESDHYADEDEPITPQDLADHDLTEEDAALADLVKRADAIDSASVDALAEQYAEDLPAFTKAIQEIVTNAQSQQPSEPRQDGQRAPQEQEPAASAQTSDQASDAEPATSGTGQAEQPVAAEKSDITPDGKTDISEPKTSQVEPKTEPKAEDKPKKLPYASKEDQEHLFGIDKKREKALKRIDKGTAYFGSEAKAKEWIKEHGIADTHEAKKNDKGTRFDIVAKDGAKPAESANSGTKEELDPHNMPKGTKVPNTNWTVGDTAMIADWGNHDFSPHTVMGFFLQDEGTKYEQTVLWLQNDTGHESTHLDGQLYTPEQVAKIQAEREAKMAEETKGRPATREDAEKDPGAWSENGKAPKQEAPGTRKNGKAEKAAALRLESLLKVMPAVMKPQGQSARQHVRSVVEELNKEKTVVDIVPMLETASDRFLKAGHAPFADVIDEVIETLKPQPAATEQAPAPTNDKAALLTELREKLSALSDRAFAAGDGKLSGRISSFTQGMKADDRNLSRAWVNEVVAEREKMVKTAERKASKSQPKEAPAAEHPLIKQLRDDFGDVIAASQIDQAAEELRNGDDTLAKDLIRINKYRLERDRKAAEATAGVKKGEVIQLSKDVPGEYLSGEKEYKVLDVTDEGVHLEGVESGGRVHVRMSNFTRLVTPLLIERQVQDFVDGKRDTPPDVPAPLPASDKRQGEVGMMLESGEVVLTASGRETTPFPKVNVGTKVGASRTVKAVDQWLMRNALQEATARGDQFNARQFEANWQTPSQSDKDSAEEYLFGQQPNVVPSALKPLTDKRDALKEDTAKAKAQADLMAGLADLADIFGKNAKFNITPEQENKLIPVLTKVMDAAFRLGYYKFKDAARFVVNTIRDKIGSDVSDQITLDHLQGAYISMAGKYKDQGADSKKEVIGFDSLEDVLTEKPVLGTLRETFYNALKAGNLPKDNNALRKMVAEFDGKEVDNARLKQGQEDLEAAIAQYARDIARYAPARGKSVQATFAELLELYQNQPNLNIRTSTSVENQAYSTPAPLAYLAAKLAHITGQSKVYEPTAGNGMLLLTADPKNATANELEDQRFGNLKAQGFNAHQGDALDAIDNGVVKANSQDAIITNPPFGSVKDASGQATKVLVDGFKLGKIDHLIAARALDAMKEDGHATLILGADKVAGGLSTDDRIFFNWLYGNYNVTSHFEVEGKLYARQGANWPVRVITVSGRAKSNRVSPPAGTIERATNWSEVYAQYEKGLAAQNSPGQSASAAGSSSGVAPNTGTAPAANGNQDRPTGGSGRTPGARDSGNVGGISAGNGNNRPDNAGNGVAGRDPDVGRNDGGTQQNPVGEGRTDAKPGNNASTPGSGRNDAGKSDRKAVAEGLSDAENQFQITYTPRSARKDEGVLVPVNMAQPLQDALSALEDEVGDIDAFAAKELGYDSTEQLHDALMGLQVDSVASAINNIKQRGKATIIADQTGIGKGRQAAAMLRWALKNGYTPVFLTVKPQLYTDMYGDLADIGTDDLHPLIFNTDEAISGKDGEKLYANRPGKHKKTLQDIAATAELPEGRNAVFLTYSQINVANTQRQALMALGEKAIIVMDEAHNAAGDSSTGEFVRGLLDIAPGVVYLSATYAKRPDNMPLYFKTDMGDAISDNGTLLDAMAAGGLPLQTVISNNLVKSGQMFRRERSYDGVSIATFVDSDKRVDHEKLSDSTTEALRAIVDADRLFHDVYFKEMKKAMEKEGGDMIDNAGNQAQESVNHTEFSSVVHNFIRQMQLGLKADRAADEAIASIKRGEKPLIALENTMGSFLMEYAQNNGIKEGDSLEGFDYRTVLTRALDRTRYLTFVLPNGEKEKRYVPLSKLPDSIRSAYVRAQRVIDGLAIDLPVSPIDHMRMRLEKAGYSVAEITGRTLAVDYKTKVPTLTKVPQEEVDDKVATTRRFNSGKLDAIILNVAGSTGISLHASEKFSDQRPRHMIVAQPAQDINIFMQMLGRIHRTGQVVLPKYTILTLDLPSEKRPTALLSKKMKSLNANTSSNTESATSIKAADMMNKYGDQIIGTYLAENMDFAHDLDLHDSAGPDAVDIARKATGRVALMPVEVQHAFYNEVEDQYQALIDYLNKTNQNDLEPKTFDFDAKLVKEEVMVDQTSDTSPFGEAAVYGEYSIKAQGKAMTPAEVKAESTDNLGGMTPALHAAGIVGRLMENGAANMQADRIKRAKSGKPFVSKDGVETFFTMEEVTKNPITAEQFARVPDPRTEEGRSFIHGHQIGSAWRIEVNGDVMNAVVTNIKANPSKSGNPFSKSKIQVTLAVNNPLRSITIPASQWQKVEVAPLYGERIERLFSDKPSEARDTAKIVTGNLLAAYGEMNGARGTIISFTTAAGTIEQGILLPKVFSMKDNTRGDYMIRTAGEVMTYLQKSNHKDIDRFGVSTRDGIVRVLPNGRGIRIQVPKSKAKGGKYFLDKKLIESTGDFFSQGSSMVAQVYDAAKATQAIEHLMKRAPLYASPSMAEDAREVLNDPRQAPPKAGGDTLHASTSAQSSDMDYGVAALVKEGTSVNNLLAHIEANTTNPDHRELARALRAQKLKTGILAERAKGTYAADIEEGTVRGAYNPATDTAYLHQEAGAEQTVLHELTHAATIKGLQAGGPAAQAMIKLYEYIAAKPKFAREYGATNVEEFVSEANTNPRFRQMLADSPAPGVQVSAWTRFVAIVRMLIGKPAISNNALKAVMEITPKLMAENRKAAAAAKNSPVAFSRTVGRPDTNSEGKKIAHFQPSLAAFDKWFDGSKAVDEQGRPLVLYHGTDQQFNVFDKEAVGNNFNQDQRGFFFTDNRKSAESYARNTSYGTSRDEPGIIVEAYLSIKNPLIVRIDYDPINEWDSRHTELQEAAADGGHDGVIIKADKYESMYVAFEPNQIKSVDNFGGWDARSDDIRFLRTTANSTMQSVAERIADQFNTQKTFNWWHRTIGTQYHKALKHAGFKKVFDGVQAYMRDTTSFALQAEAKAPDILPKMETVKDLAQDVKRMVGNRSFDSLKKADREALAKAIYTGTLDKKVWSDDELTDELDFTPQQIRLYRQYMAAINDSLESLAKSEIVRLAKLADMPDTDGLMDMPIQDVADAVHDQLNDGVRAELVAYLEDLALNNFYPDARFMESIEDEGSALEIAKKFARDYEPLTQQVAKVNALVRHLTAAERIVKQNKKLQKEGYVPLMRFGRYFVHVKDDQGLTSYFAMYESEAEANKMARDLREDNPDFDVIQGITSQEQFKLMKGISPETMALFAEAAGVERDDMLQQYYKLAANNHSTLKRLIHRKGTDGYSEDVTRALAAFITSNARKSSGNINLGSINQAADAIREGDVKDEAIRLTEYVQNPVEEARALRGLMFAWFMGGSVASAIVNMTQPTMMAYPKLAEFGAGKAAKALIASQGLAARFATGFKPTLDADLTAALKQAQEDGIVSPQEIHQLMATAGGAGASSKAVSHLSKVWGSFFSVSESFNRYATFIAAYRLAKDAGRTDPYQYAVNAVYDTQGIYNKGNRPNWARGAVGATLFTFKQFSIAYLEFFSRLPKKQKAIALTLLILAAGTDGLPFEDDLEDLIDAMAAKLGIAWNTEAEKHRFLTDALGDAGYNFVTRGISAFLPFDISGRMSMGNLVPGSGVLNPTKEDKLREGAEALGAVGGIVKAAGALYEGRFSEALPVAVSNLYKGIKIAETGQIQTGAGKKVTDAEPGDALFKAIGLNPSTAAKASRVQGINYGNKALYQAKKKELTGDLVEAIVANDPQKRTEARDAIRAWNKKNGDTLPIVINPAAIARQVKERKMDADARQLRYTPREMRRQLVRQENDEE